MPLNVRRFYTSILLVFVSSVISAGAQTITPPAAAPIKPPTSGDVMRDRISKAKAFIAVRNYNAAIYELENIRRETGDKTVHGVVNVLLMNSYLEQGDYKRAQDLLNEFYAVQKTHSSAAASYMAVAGQIVKGSRDRVERYRALGLSVTDRTLPLEASNDLEKMRETLELVITQSKEIGTNKSRTADAMAMLEEASNSRVMLARDDYDSRRWKDELADTREKVVNSRSVVMSAVNDPNSQTAVVETTPEPQPATMQPVAEVKPNSVRDREVKLPQPSSSTVAQNNQPIIVPSAPATVREQPDTTGDQPAGAAVVAPGPGAAEPVDVGSLLSYATRQTQPVYPSMARSMRTMGTVKVEIVIDEAGDVAEVQKTSGPTMLQSAAKDAIRGWKFKPFLRDGQPVKATGFVNFKFAL